MSHSLSRRRFLHGVLGASGALAVAAACRSTAQSAAPLAAPSTPPKLLGIDMHNHVYPAGTEPLRPDAPPDPEASSGAALRLADALARSGFTAVCASYVLDFAPSGAPGDAYASFSRWLDAVDAELAAGHLRRALTAADLEAAAAHGPPTIVQTVEGAMFIEGALERIDEVHRRGLRALQLLHERDDAVAPLGDTNTAAPHLGGLSATGARVIEACNRLGILVDLAHASHETVLGALRVARKPFVISHTSLAGRPTADAQLAERMRPRLITAEHAKVVADAGGVIGVWTHLADSLPDFAQSIAAMTDAIGVDHVGIGTDTDLLSPRAGHGTTATWVGSTQAPAPTFLDAVVAELRHHGFHQDEIERIAGRNYLRVFAAAVG